MYKVDPNNEMRKLVNKLNEWTKLYDEGNPPVSDKEWDEEYFKLVKMEENLGFHYEDSPTYKVIYENKTQLRKVKHNHPMLSLNKTKDIDELKRFVGNELCTFMCKMDGLTISLRYKDGYLQSAETRGNGEEGEDVTHNAFLIEGIPHSVSIKEEFIVDGEVICPLDFFKKNLKGTYKNPRNYAAGAIRRLNSKENENCGLQFIAWDVIKGFDEYKSLGQKLNYLSDMNFIVVPAFVNNSDDVTIDELIDNLKLEAVLYDYPIDGIVVKYDDTDYYSSLGSTAHHPSGGLAFKFYDDEYETSLLEITYDVSRTGQLTPVAIFEPIDIDGTLVSKASLHNISIMEETLGLYPEYKQPIWVAKMNMIIPQITRAVKNNIPHDHTIEDIITYCPICGSPTEIKTSESGVKILYCSNPECEGKLAQKIDHWAGKKGMDIKGFSRATIEKLINWGWIEELKDIYTLKNHKAEWISKSGFGEKSVTNILNAIEESKSTTLDKILAGIGIPLVGARVGSDLAKIFDYSYENFKEAIDGDFEFWRLDGYGWEMHNALKDFNYEELDFVVQNYLSVEKPQLTTENSNMILQGKTFVITGKLNKKRDDWIKDIESYGGKVVGSVSSKTDYLICNQKENTTKYNKAEQLGIPIITEQNFIENFLKR